MKKCVLAATTFLVCGGLAPATAAQARDCAELFVTLTCHTCHGPEGRGMVRTETKEKYHLKKKAMFQTMVDQGMPLDTVQKLIPLYDKKYEDRGQFASAVEELIGNDESKKYLDIIIGIGGRVYYHKGDLIPGFEDYPRHAGNQQLYLYHQMKDILEGRRVNGNSEAMRGIQPFLENNKVSDEDFACIAEYLSKVEKIKP